MQCNAMQYNTVQLHHTPVQFKWSSKEKKQIAETNWGVTVDNTGFTQVPFYGVILHL